MPGRRRNSLDAELRELERAAAAEPSYENRLRLAVARARVGAFEPDVAAAVMAEADSGEAALLENEVAEILHRANAYADHALTVNMEALAETVRRALDGVSTAAQETMWMIPGAMSSSGTIRYAWTHGGPPAVPDGLPGGIERENERRQVFDQDRATYVLVVVNERRLRSFMADFQTVTDVTIGAAAGSYTFEHYGDMVPPQPVFAWPELDTPEWNFTGKLGQWQDERWSRRQEVSEVGALKVWPHDRVKAPELLARQWLLLRPILFA